MERSSETAFCRLWIENGLLYVIYKPISYLDEKMAKSIVSSRILFQENEPYPIFCDTRGIMDSSKAARDYLAQEGSTLAKAIAIYDDRDVGGLMLNYYLLRNKPLVPSAIFNDRDLAINFLRGQEGL
ncbi:hypothetical protein POV26_03580 [Aequorivita todarodis]|uniref:DUF7793 family protein n=1 Tax=Aequorivita todarodis TaxID=2036821 RepID=UPI00234FFD64|nr:hypothetical protein [Aequorivita todarodis]MDC8000104.1 hypothetical protein [Aequorivita todarodis]